MMNIFSWHLSNEKKMFLFNFNRIGKNSVFVIIFLIKVKTLTDDGFFEDFVRKILWMKFFPIP